MRLPKWMYETLPLTYLVGAVVVVGAGGSLLRIPSALLLLLASVLVLRMRYLNRHARSPRRHRKQPLTW